MALEVSIVIPTYNLTGMLRNCLLSIKEAGGPEKEIILVDDGSAPPYQAYLELLEADGLCDEVVYHSENRGFAVACNSGIGAARGREIVLLNNDTWVHPGWLEALLARAAESAAIGLATSKCIYPNGRVWLTGLCFKPFRKRLQGLPADSPEANRETDLAAAAACSLLIKRRVLEETGLFDESFYNGWEDVDFCFRARSAGYRVVYCPRSVVTHYESWCRSRSPASVARIKHNRALLAAKWSEDSFLYEDPPCPP